MLLIFVCIFSLVQQRESKEKFIFVTPVNGTCIDLIEKSNDTINGAIRRYLDLPTEVDLDTYFQGDYLSNKYFYAIPLQIFVCYSMRNTN